MTRKQKETIANVYYHLRWLSAALSHEVLGDSSGIRGWNSDATYKVLKDSDKVLKSLKII